MPLSNHNLEYLDVPLDNLADGDLVSANVGVLVSDIAMGEYPLSELIGEALVGRMHHLKDWSYEAVDVHAMEDGTHIIYHVKGTYIA